MGSEGKKGAEVIFAPAALEPSEMRHGFEGVREGKVDKVLPLFRRDGNELALLTASHGVPKSGRIKWLQGGAVHGRENPGEFLGIGADLCAEFITILRGKDRREMFCAVGGVEEAGETKCAAAAPLIEELASAEKMIEKNAAVVLFGISAKFLEERGVLFEIDLCAHGGDEFCTGEGECQLLKHAESRVGGTISSGDLAAARRLMCSSPTNRITS